MRRWGVGALIAGHGWLAAWAFTHRPLRSGGDRALVAAIRAGSEAALEQLIDRYWSEVARTALAIVRDEHGAKDVAQETMITMVQSLDAYDARRPFRPWLHRIAVNKALDRLRSEQRRPRPAEDPDLTRPDPAAGDFGADVDVGLIRALGALTATDRAIVVLRHNLDYRSSEIGAMLGMPAATVRTRLARALGELRGQLEREGGDDA